VPTLLQDHPERTQPTLHTLAHDARARAAMRQRTALVSTQQCTAGSCGEAPVTCLGAPI